MNEYFSWTNVTNEVGEFLAQPNAYRSIMILILATAISYWLSRFLAKAIIAVAQKIAVRSELESNDQKVMMYRQVETYLSIVIASVRTVVVAITAYVAWRILSPAANSGVAAIGASAFFIVFAGQTLGMLLRDVTAGATMIIEKWFTVGDFIKVEPFIDVSGVVERFTLRSTKLRSLSGEVIWIHNQQMQAVQVTPRGVRSIAVDVFVRDREAGEAAIRKITQAMPTGPTLLARPLRVKNTERWGDDLWRIIVVGHTTPGREWLIEKYFVSAIMEIDKDATDPAKRIIVQQPIARFSDPEVDRRFKRAIRLE